MPQIKVGLAPGKASYWDPITRTYITLENKVQIVNYTDASELERICHALFGPKPALKLYEGKIPQEAIDAWKEKFNFKGLQMAKDRADEINTDSASVVSAAIENPEEVNMQTASSDNRNESNEDLSQKENQNVLTEDEIKNMTKKEIQDYIQENKIELEDVNSRSTASEHTKALLKYFGYETDEEF